jgi:hypothetical protein
MYKMIDRLDNMILNGIHFRSAAGNRSSRSSTNFVLQIAAKNYRKLTPIPYFKNKYC